MGIWQRRRLGTHLRGLRTAAGLDAGAASAALQWQPHKLERLEAGLAGIRRADYKELVAAYGAEPEEALLAGTRDWWAPYSDDIGDDYETMLILEESAVRIRTQTAGLIPGLFQTRGYAAGLLGTRRDQPWPRMERLVRLRLERARVLSGDIGPEVEAVIDEAALRRPVGGAAGMRAQYQHLIELAHRPRVTILVRPFAAPPFREAGFTFHLFALPEEPGGINSVVQLEEFDREYFEWTAAEVDRYADAFDRSRAGALDPDASIVFLTRLAAR
ncbi:MULTISPECIES: helix-turn-helix transcriptional regulator [unclassified Actinomadura]|uniref:helix-turn-helix domain-containing protein n=1 Tax=unclassified Actinomadura TaxID=2626254 RepID=UPI001358655D|nr:helix-turn-helix transcriptional regulator [Actinomadura sp. K4S16]